MFLLTDVLGVFMRCPRALISMSKEHNRNVHAFTKLLPYTIHKHKVKKQVISKNTQIPP